MKNNIAFTLLATLIIGIFGATVSAIQFSKPTPYAFADNNGNNSQNNGNHGTIKIDGGDLDNLPNNEPKVGCKFQLDAYNYDANITLTITITTQSPTQPKDDEIYNNTLQLDNDDATGANEAGWDGSLNIDLSNILTNYSVQPQQGYHVKMDVTHNGQVSNNAKHKTFYINECDTSEEPEEESVSLSVGSCLVEDKNTFRFKAVNKGNVGKTFRLQNAGNSAELVFFGFIASGSAVGGYDDDTYSTATEATWKKQYFDGQNWTDVSGTHVTSIAGHSRNENYCPVDENNGETPSPSPSPTETAPTPTSGNNPTATPTPGSSNNPTATPTPGNGEVLSANDTNTKTPTKGVLGASTLAGTGTFTKTAANAFSTLAIAFFILSGAAYAKKNYKTS